MKKARFDINGYLSGYPDECDDYQVPTKSLPQLKAELFKVHSHSAPLIHRLCQTIYYDYLALVQGLNPGDSLDDMNRLEHCMRILENVAFQLVELTDWTYKKYYTDSKIDTLH